MTLRNPLEEEVIEPEPELVAKPAPKVVRKRAPRRPVNSTTTVTVIRGTKVETTKAKS